MKIYRFEKEDGAGPFFLINGKRLVVTQSLKETNEFFGFYSLEKLKEYFEEDKELVKNMKLIVYDVPAAQVRFYKNGEVSFSGQWKHGGIELKRNLWEAEEKNEG